MNPTTVEHIRTTSPAGPHSSSVRATSSTSTALLSARGRILPTIRDIALPVSIVRWYPAAEPTAAASSRSRKGPDAKPSRESPRTSPMARAVPDLPLPETARVTRARTEVTVPTEATVEMNLAGSRSGNTAADIDAPTVAVIPGNHPARVPMTTPRIPGPGPTGSLTRSLCSGILVPSDVDSMTGIPKSPVSRGIMTLPSPRAPSTGMGRTMHPRPSAPDTRKATAPQIPLPLRHSFISSTAHAARSTTGVSLSSRSPAPLTSAHCSGSARRIDAEHPTRLPMAAARTASIPLPASSSRCPGRTDTASSESGAPMNTEGTKSTNECTTDADMMQDPTAIAAQSSGRAPSIAGYAASMTAARVLTWIPGTMPLNVPMAHPARDMATHTATTVGSMAHPRRMRT